MSCLRHHIVASQARVSSVWATQMDPKIASMCIFQLAIFDIVTFRLGMLWKQPLNSLDKGPPCTTACKMRLMRITIRALCTIIPLYHLQQLHSHIHHVLYHSSRRPLA